MLFFVIWIINEPYLEFILREQTIEMQISGKREDTAIEIDCHDE